MRLALAALVVCAALTGCAGSAPEPESTPAGESTPSAIEAPGSGEPTEAAPEDPADPSTWIVSGAGIGPVELGGAVAEYSVVGPYTEEASTCPNPAVHTLTGDGLAPMRLVAVDGGTTIDSVHVTSWGTDGAVVAPRTADGITLGSSLADLQATYPGIELTDEYSTTLQYAYSDAGNWVVFTVQDDAVVELTASTTSSNPTEYCG
jgi:hypothetical protein